MDTAASTRETRRDRLQRQLAELESTIQTLELRKNTDEHARGEYYRLKVVWARKKALLDACTGGE